MCHSYQKEFSKWENSQCFIVLKCTDVLFFPHKSLYLKKKKMYTFKIPFLLLVLAFKVTFQNELVNFHFFSVVP